MMNPKLTQAFQYIALLLQKYNELQAAQNVHPFRISSMKDTENGVTVTFQVSGKATFLQASAEEILSDDSFTNRFPSIDIRSLTEFQNKIKQPTSELNSDTPLIIEGKAYNQALNKIMVNFVAQDGSRFSKPASEIVLDHGIVQLLSPKDAISIGYIAGYEHSQEPR